MYNLGQYVARKSIIQKFDPRVKIIAAIALSIIILRANNISLLVLTLTILAIACLGRISPFYLLKAAKPMMPFFAFLFLIYILSTPGPSLNLWTFGPLVIKLSYSGLKLGALQTWKFILLIMAASVLTLTTSPSEFTIGLEKLLRPMKLLGISSHNIAMMISLALRFIPTLQKEINDIKTAQMARGAEFNLHWRTISRLALPLLINVFQHSDELVNAMEARGYQPGPRTYLHELVLSSKEYFLIGIIIIVLVITLL